MQEKELKKKLFETGEYEAYCALKRQLLIHEDYSKLRDCEYFNLSSKEIKACEQMNACKRKQRWTVNKRLKKWVEDGNKVYFATFTFNDSALNKKSRTRRNYISSMLRNNTEDYMAIIDYSDDEREHYHAIFIVNKPFKFNRSQDGKLFCDWLNNYERLYGFYNVKLIKNTKNDYNRVKNYLVKKKISSIMYENSNLIIKRRR